MSTLVFQRIRRNLLSSLGLALVCFALTTFANLVLLGWFGHQGGVSLIGLWGVLITVMSFVLLGDYGFRDALTQMVAIEGPDRPLAIVLRLCSWTLVISLLATAMALAGAALLTVEPKFIWGGLMAAWAGALQIASGWVLSLRLGRHEQGWWHLKAVIRVLTQSAAAPTLMLGTEMDWIVALGLSLLLGGIAETLLTFFACRKDLGLASPAAAWAIPARKVLAVTRGFGPANVLQRLQEPMIRTLLARLGGLDVLGTFTVAWKMPQTASAAVSEGLRPLLPGLSDLLQRRETGKAASVIGQSLFLQMALSVPISLFLWIHALPVFEIWLGLSDPALVRITRVMVLGYAAINLTVPFFWSLQAYGHAGTIAWLTALNIAIIVAVCTPALVFLDDAILVSALGIVLSQFVFSLSVHLICQRRWGLVRASYRHVPWGRVVALNGPALAYNGALSTVWDPTAGPIWLLALAVAGTAALYGAAWGFIILLPRRVGQGTSPP